MSACSVNRQLAREADLIVKATQPSTLDCARADHCAMESPLRELAEALDPRCFRQVHRSTIVNMRAVAAVSRDGSGRGVLQLKGRSETLLVSQSFMSLFRGM